MFFVFALVAASSARATVTVGSDLANAPETPGFCSATCTRVLVAPPSGKGASPVTGTVVRWRFRTAAGGEAQMVFPRVIRPLGTEMDGGTRPRRKLALGRYRLIIVARDAAGHAGAQRRIAFRIVK